MVNGNSIIGWGRYRNKTFEEVFSTDQEFCRLVLRENGIHESKTRDFREFLLDKTSMVNERSCKFFIKALSPHIYEKFRNFVGTPNVQVRKIHEGSRVDTNGFLGVFYKLFAKKCISNFKDEDGVASYVSQYRNVFPFKVSADVPRKGHEIMKLFEQDMKNDIRTFIDTHFDNINDQDICELFLCNIYNYRFNALVEIITKKVKGKSISNIYCPENFPQLNSDGAAKYLYMYKVFDEIVKTCKHTTNVQGKDYDLKYFLKLPQLNFRELYSLLDSVYLENFPKMYIQRFKKYLFFFINALHSETKPIFFIDDVLFECMKCWTTYTKSRQNVFEILSSIALLTTVQRRKQPQDRFHHCIDLKNLQYVKSYIESFPNLKEAIVECEVRTDHLESTIMALVGDVCLNMCYSKIRRNKISEFYRSICFASLYPKKVKRLVVYNAYLGEESSIEMPPIEDEVRNFINKYNLCDCTVPLPAAKFITWGSEKYFVEGTIEE